MSAAVKLLILIALASALIASAATAAVEQSPRWYAIAALFGALGVGVLIVAFRS